MVWYAVPILIMGWLFWLTWHVGATACMGHIAQEQGRGCRTRCSLYALLHDQFVKRNPRHASHACGQQAVLYTSLGMLLLWMDAWDVAGIFRRYGLCCEDGQGLPEGAVPMLQPHLGARVYRPVASCGALRG